MFKQLLLKATVVAALACMSATALAEEKTIKIGSQVPLTGGLARVGLDFLEGIQVAVKQANDDNEGQYQFELLTIDDETAPAKAVAAVEKLASQGVVALTGGYGSNIVGPASGAAHELGIPYITSGGMAVGLTQRGFKNFFRLSNLEGYSKAMAGLAKMVDADKVSIVYNNVESTTDLAEALERALDKAGIESVIHSYDGSTGNFTPLVNRIRLQDRPDVIAMVGYENDYIAILRAAKILKPDIKAIVGGWSLATAQMNSEFNDVVQGVAGTSMLPYPVHFSGGEAQRFAETFTELHDKTPDYIAQFSYVQTKLLIEAILRADKAGEITGESIAREMHKTDSETLIGRVTFDENGDNPHFANHIGQHQGDKVELVWPESAATAQMVLPGRPW